MSALSEVVFDYPYLLVLALALPLLAVLVLRHAYVQRRARLERLGSMDVISRLIPPNTLAPPGWRMTRLGLASALVGVAVAGGEPATVLAVLAAAAEQCACDDQRTNTDELFHMHLVNDPPWPSAR